MEETKSIIVANTIVKDYETQLGEAIPLRKYLRDAISKHLDTWKPVKKGFPYYASMVTIIYISLLLISGIPQLIYPPFQNAFDGNMFLFRNIVSIGFALGYVMGHMDMTDDDWDKKK